MCLEGVDILPIFVLNLRCCEVFNEVLEVDNHREPVIIYVTMVTFWEKE
jgi:hypothetical protein